MQLLPTEKQMKHQNQKLSGLKEDSKNTLAELNPKEKVEYYIDTAKMLGFTRKEAIEQLHSRGIYLNNIPSHFLS